VLDERASGVVSSEDQRVDELLGEVLSEEGGEGGERDVGGGEPEVLYYDLSARIELGRLRIKLLESNVALEVFIGKGKWDRWIIRRAETRGNCCISGYCKQWLEED